SSKRDWSSDVCSSDLVDATGGTGGAGNAQGTFSNGAGGPGGSVSGEVPVTPGSTLYVEVGGAGGGGTQNGPGAGGWNGGADGGKVGRAPCRDRGWEAE